MRYAAPRYFTRLNSVADAASRTERPAAAAATCTSVPAWTPSAETSPARAPLVHAPGDDVEHRGTRGHQEQQGRGHEDAEAPPFRQGDHAKLRRLSAVDAGDIAERIVQPEVRLLANNGPRHDGLAIRRRDDRVRGRREPGFAASTVRARRRCRCIARRLVRVGHDGLGGRNRLGAAQAPPARHRASRPIRGASLEWDAMSRSCRSNLHALG